MSDVAYIVAAQLFVVGHWTGWLTYWLIWGRR